MERDFVSRLIGRFNDAGVRYLVAGGFAVVAHGYDRFTADLDLIIHFEKSNALLVLEI